MLTRLYELTISREDDLKANIAARLASLSETYRKSVGNPASIRSLAQKTPPEAMSQDDLAGLASYTGHAAGRDQVVEQVQSALGEVLQEMPTRTAGTGSRFRNALLRLRGKDPAELEARRAQEVRDKVFATLQDRPDFPSEELLVERQHRLVDETARTAFSDGYRQQLSDLRKTVQKELNAIPGVPSARDIRSIVSRVGVTLVKENMSGREVPVPANPHRAQLAEIRERYDGEIDLQGKVDLREQIQQFDKATAQGQAIKDARAYIDGRDNAVLYALEVHAGANDIRTRDNEPVSWKEVSDFSDYAKKVGPEELSHQVNGLLQNLKVNDLGVDLTKGTGTEMGTQGI
jgi:hypothetical protein